MKKVLIICLFIWGGSLFAPLSHAQTQQSSMVVLTPYSYMQDLDFFFDNSTYAMAFYDGNGIDRSLFLSIVTPDQYKDYLREGYAPEVIDKNAGDITQYYELTNGRNPNTSNEIVEPANLKQPFELVYPMTRTKTLIKLPTGIQFKPFKFAGGQYYKQRQLTNSIQRPTNRAFLRQELGVTQNNKSSNINQQESTTWGNIQRIVSFIVLLGLVVFVILMLRKNPSNNNA